MRRPGAEPQKVLDIAGGAGQRARGHAKDAQAQFGGAGGDRADGLGAQFRAADHTAAAEAFLADLELRLDHQDEVGAGRGAGGEGGQDQAQRDEGEIADDQVDGDVVDPVEGQLADVGAVLDGDPLIALQGPGELAVADVDGDDMGGPGAQQDVGEAAGGRPGVEGAAPLDAQPEGDECREGPGELVSAARDVVRIVRILADDHGGAGGDLGGGLGRGRAADGHPSRGDQLTGVLPRAGQLAAHQLRVESASCHSCHLWFSS